MADTADLSPAAARRTGSSPVLATDDTWLHGGTADTPDLESGSLGSVGSNPTGATDGRRQTT